MDWIGGGGGEESRGREEGIAEGAQRPADELQAGAPGSPICLQHGHGHALSASPHPGPVPSPHLAVHHRRPDRLLDLPQFVGSISGRLRNVNHSSRFFHRRPDNVS